MKTETVRFRVTKEEGDGLRSNAKRRNASVSELIIEALNAYLPQWRKGGK